MRHGRFTDMKRILLILALVWSVSARAATGEVELIGAIVASIATATNNINDGDLTTAWTDNPSGWIGYDLGTGTNATITGYLFATQPSTPGNYTKETYIQGAQLQSDTTPSFSAPTTRDTVPSFPFYPRYKMHERVATGSARCFRILFPSTNYAGIAELRLYAAAGTTARARPVPPVISPWGGRFPTGSRTVTLTSRTTSASIYYTTNGTVPTTSSLLYSGPFTLSFSTNLNFRAIAYDASLSTTTSAVSSNAVFVPWSFKPSEGWRDDGGTVVEAHAGDILNNTATDGFYYWYGMALNYPDAGGSDIPPDGYKGVWCYKSTDMRNWQFVGNILGGNPYQLQRQHVIRNDSTGLLVMYMHNVSGSTFATAIATSTLPVGPWAFYTTNTTSIQYGGKDQNLFKDIDGKAYFVAADTNQTYGTGKMRITQLSSDYLSGTTNQVIAVNSGVESPVLFRNGSGAYYLIFSAANYYDNLSTYNERWITCTNILGAWTNSTINQLWTVDPVNDVRYSPANIYNGQPTFAFKYSNQWILGRDQWHNSTTEPSSSLYASRQVWVPFAFDGAGNIVVPSPVPVPWEPSVLPTYGTVRQMTGKSKRSGNIK